MSGRWRRGAQAFLRRGMAPRLLCTCLGAIAAWVLLSPFAGAEERFITVASTTSTENSGLFAAILPRFEAKDFKDLIHVGPSGTLKLTGAILRALRPVLPSRDQAAANAP